MTAAEQRVQNTRILDDLLNGWQFAAAIAVDASPRYPELVKVAAERARKALDQGLSPYLTLVMVVAPVLRTPTDPELEMYELIDENEASDA